jgi:hypothetical protein
VKITKTQLKKIIKEELGRVLAEGKKKIEFTKDFTYDTPGGENTIKAGDTRTLEMGEDGKANIVIGHGNYEYVPKSHFKIA